MKAKSLLITTDQFGGFIHACPYCHRYVKRESGTRICRSCYGKVDNDRLQSYQGRVNFDGGGSWRRKYNAEKIGDAATAKESEAAPE